MGKSCFDPNIFIKVVKLLNKKCLLRFGFNKSKLQKNQLSY